MRIPFVSSAFKAIRNKRARYRLRSKSTRDIFTEIHRENVWGGDQSLSGPGSDSHQTKTIALEIENLLSEIGISSILDIPCGDFHWMKTVKLNGIDYTGADIVEEIVHRNNEMYAEEGIRFQGLNLIEDSLPEVDLILCRDCLVHFKFSDIFLALENACRSESEYFLTTLFTERTENLDIATGQWRTLDLQLDPFNLPMPKKIIHEQCTEGDGAYTDKALGLWRLGDIRKCLTTR